MEKIVSISMDSLFSADCHQSKYPYDNVKIHLPEKMIENGLFCVIGHINFTCLLLISSHVNSTDIECKCKAVDIGQTEDDEFHC